jgi:hypothetical protein
MRTAPQEVKEEISVSSSIFQALIYPLIIDVKKGTKDPAAMAVVTPAKTYNFKAESLSAILSLCLSRS